MATNEPPQIYDDIFKLLVLHLDKTTDGRFHAKDLSVFVKAGYSAGVLRPTLKYLVDKGYFHRTYEKNSAVGMFGGGPDEFWELTAPGLDRSITEDIRTGANRSLQERPDNIPAADRFVSIDDNQHLVVEAKESLIELSTAIKDANKIVADREDQIRLSREVDYISELISQPRIHISALWDAAKNNSTLKWLIEQTVNDTVRNLAAKALEHLDKLLSILTNFKS